LTSAPLLISSFMNASLSCRKIIKTNKILKCDVKRQQASMW
jgi:hypothetical protein